MNQYKKIKINELAHFGYIPNNQFLMLNFENTNRSFGLYVKTDNKKVLFALYSEETEILFTIDKTQEELQSFLQENHEYNKEQVKKELKKFNIKEITSKNKASIIRELEKVKLVFSVNQRQEFQIRSSYEVIKALKNQSKASDFSEFNQNNFVCFGNTYYLLNN